MTGLDNGNQLTLRVLHPADAVWGRAEVSRFLEHHLGSTRRTSEIAIAASELLTNVIKYGVRGTVSLEVEQQQTGAHITLIAEDNGPGFQHPRRALEDGYSEGHVVGRRRSGAMLAGLGTGLGAVARLMDEVDIGRGPKGGARVVARCSLPNRPDRG